MFLYRLAAQSISDVEKKGNCNSAENQAVVLLFADLMLPILFRPFLIDPFDKASSALYVGDLYS